MNLQSKIQNLYCRMKSMRFLTLLIIWGFMVDDMLRLYRNLAMELNVKDSFAILPFTENGVPCAVPDKRHSYSDSCKGNSGRYKSHLKYGQDC